MYTYHWKYQTSNSTSMYLLTADTDTSKSNSMFGTHSHAMHGLTILISTLGFDLSVHVNRKPNIEVKFDVGYFQWYLLMIFLKPLVVTPAMKLNFLTTLFFYFLQQRTCTDKIKRLELSTLVTRRLCFECQSQNCHVLERSPLVVEWGPYDHIFYDNCAKLGLICHIYIRRNFLKTMQLSPPLNINKSFIKK